MLPSFSVSKKSDTSYWWLAWSVRPIADSDDGGRWAGFAVVALNWNGSQCGVYSFSALPSMLSLCAPQTAPPLLDEVGANPPWNQPHVTCREFSRSPMFSPVSTPSGLVDVWLESEHSS